MSIYHRLKQDLRLENINVKNSLVVMCKLRSQTQFYEQ